MPTSNTCCNWTQAVGQAYAMLFHNCAQSARGIFIMFKRWKSGCQRVGIRRPETTLKHVSNIWNWAFCRPSMEWRQTIFRIRWSDDPKTQKKRMDWPKTECSNCLTRCEDSRHFLFAFKQWSSSWQVYCDWVMGIQPHFWNHRNFDCFLTTHCGKMFQILTTVARCSIWTSNKRKLPSSFLYSTWAERLIFDLKY